jgi:two-component system response regulator DegU
MTAKAPSSRRVRVLLADDHVLVRRALRQLLESAGGVDVLAEVSDGPTAVAEAQRLCPDAVILDIALPCLDGVQAAAAIRLLCPKTKVLLLSFDEDPVYVRRAMLAGAAGFVGKSGVDRWLIPALRRVLAGQTFLASPERTTPGNSQPRLQARALPHPSGYETVPDRHMRRSPPG